jgi:hypothetical protein
MEGDDPPVACTLTDLSPGGCYVEIATPFPIRSRVMLAVTNSNRRLEAVGLVRIAHPENGMGIEFACSTTSQKENLEAWIQALIHSKEQPSLEVRPEGMEESSINVPEYRRGSDPLLDLFHSAQPLAMEAFLDELRKQRTGHGMAAVGA